MSRPWSLPRKIIVWIAVITASSSITAGLVVAAYQIGSAG